jgi:Ca2+-binding EF-hand superfamily protein
MKYVNRFDKDGNGVMDFPEFWALTRAERKAVREKKVQEEKVDENANTMATRIQARQRGIKAREQQALRNTSATHIQAMQRGRKARKEVAKMREEAERNRKKNAAPRAANLETSASKAQKREKVNVEPTLKTNASKEDHDKELQRRKSEWAQKRAKNASAKVNVPRVANVSKPKPKADPNAGNKNPAKKAEAQKKKNDYDAHSELLKKQQLEWREKQRQRKLQTKQSSPPRVASTSKGQGKSKGDAGKGDTGGKMKISRRRVTSGRKSGGDDCGMGGKDAGNVLLRTFALYDKDGDGHVDQKELVKWDRALKNWSIAHAPDEVEDSIVALEGEATDFAEGYHRVSHHVFEEGLIGLLLSHKADGIHIAEIEPNSQADNAREQGNLKIGMRLTHIADLITRNMSVDQAVQALGKSKRPLKLSFSESDRMVLLGDAIDPEGSNDRAIHSIRFPHFERWFNKTYREATTKGTYGIAGNAEPNSDFFAFVEKKKATPPEISFFKRQSALRDHVLSKALAAIFDQHAYGKLSPHQMQKWMMNLRMTSIQGARGTIPSKSDAEWIVNKMSKNEDKKGVDRKMWVNWMLGQLIDSFTDGEQESKELLADSGPRQLVYQEFIANVMREINTNVVKELRVALGVPESESHSEKTYGEKRAALNRDMKAHRRETKKKRAAKEHGDALRVESTKWRSKQASGRSSTGKLKVDASLPRVANMSTSSSKAHTTSPSNRSPSAAAAAAAVDHSKEWKHNDLNDLTVKGRIEAVKQRRKLELDAKLRKEREDWKRRQMAKNSRGITVGKLPRRMAIAKKKKEKQEAEKRKERERKEKAKMAAIRTPEQIEASRRRRASFRARQEKAAERAKSRRLEAELRARRRREKEEVGFIFSEEGPGLIEPRKRLPGNTMNNRRNARNGKYNRANQPTTNETNRSPMSSDIRDLIFDCRFQRNQPLGMELAFRQVKGLIVTSVRVGGQAAGMQPTSVCRGDRVLLIAGEDMSSLRESECMERARDLDDRGPRGSVWVRFRRKRGHLGAPEQESAAAAGTTPTAAGIDVSSSENTKDATNDASEAEAEGEVTTIKNGDAGDASYASDAGSPGVSESSVSSAPLRSNVDEEYVKWLEERRQGHSETSRAEQQRELVLSIPKANSKKHTGTSEEMLRATDYDIEKRHWRLISPRPIPDAWADFKSKQYTVIIRDPPMQFEGGDGETANAVGIRLKQKSKGLHIKAIEPGTLAARAAEVGGEDGGWNLNRGDLLVRIGSVSAEHGMAKKAALELIETSARPLTLTFRLPEGTDYVVRFPAGVQMGFALKELRAGVAVSDLQPNSPAQKSGQINSGHVLSTISGKSVAGLSADDIIDVLAASEESKGGPPCHVGFRRSNHYDEYEKRVRKVYDAWVDSWVDDWVMGSDQGDVVELFRHDLGHPNFTRRDAVLLGLAKDSSNDDDDGGDSPPHFESIFDAHWTLFEAKARKAHERLLGTLERNERGNNTLDLYACREAFLELDEHLSLRETATFLRNNLDDKADVAIDGDNGTTSRSNVLRFGKFLDHVLLCGCNRHHTEIELQATPVCVMFKKWWDKNNRGSLTCADIFAASLQIREFALPMVQTHVGRPTLAHAEHAMELLDADGDGVAEYEELQAVMGVRAGDAKIGQRPSDDAYSKEDADALFNGEVLLEELTAFVIEVNTAAMDAALRELFSQYDMDCSGGISQGELHRWMLDMHQQATRGAQEDEGGRDSAPLAQVRRPTSEDARSFMAILDRAEMDGEIDTQVSDEAFADRKKSAQFADGKCSIEEITAWMKGKHHMNVADQESYGAISDATRSRLLFFRALLKQTCAVASDIVDDRSQLEKLMECIRSQELWTTKVEAMMKSKKNSRITSAVEEPPPTLDEEVPSQTGAADVTGTASWESWDAPRIDTPEEVDVKVEMSRSLWYEGQGRKHWYRSNPEGGIIVRGMDTQTDQSALPLIDNTTPRKGEQQQGGMEAASSSSLSLSSALLPSVGRPSSREEGGVAQNIGVARNSKRTLTTPPLVQPKPIIHTLSPSPKRPPMGGGNASGSSASGATTRVLGGKMPRQKKLQEPQSQWARSPRAQRQTKVLTNRVSLLDRQEAVFQKHRQDRKIVAEQHAAEVREKEKKERHRRARVVAAQNPRGSRIRKVPQSSPRVYEQQQQQQPQQPYLSTIQQPYVVEAQYPQQHQQLNGYSSYHQQYLEQRQLQQLQQQKQQQQYYSEPPQQYSRESDQYWNEPAQAPNVSSFETFEAFDQQQPALQFHNTQQYTGTVLYRDGIPVRAHEKGI